MTDPFNLERFVTAEEPVFDTALSELRAGKKRTHWMWFIFPQRTKLPTSAGSNTPIEPNEVAKAGVPLAAPQRRRCRIRISA